MPSVPMGFTVEIGRGVGATFLACLYVGADATTPKRGLLRQYLEAVSELSITYDLS